MSVYYSIFAEVNIDGKWYNLCPYFRDKNGKAKTHNIFWAQSIFTEVYYHLCEYAIGRGVPEDMPFRPAWKKRRSCVGTGTLHTDIGSMSTKAPNLKKTQTSLRTMGLGSLRWMPVPLSAERSMS